MDEHESNDVVKALVAAESGAGKTGSLAALADEGFHLHILDYDNGLSPIKHYVKRKESLRNVFYETLRDEMGFMAGKATIKKANAFQRGMDLLEKGKEGWGPPAKDMTPRDVIVIDTLGKLSRSSLMNVMLINNAAMKAPEIQHYGTAMENIEKMLEMLTSDAYHCHVIINTHLARENDSPKLHPESIGSKLNPKIARNFDNYFSISMTGAKRTFKTAKDGLLMLKSAKPLSAEYDIADGWPKIFKELTGVADLKQLTEA